VSGAQADRPGLQQAIDQLRAGDPLVVWRLDRLGRSLRHLIETVQALAQRGVGFKSLTESIDTTNSSGKLIFHIFGALAEFERDLIRERTQKVALSGRSAMAWRIRSLVVTIAPPGCTIADRLARVSAIETALVESRTGDERE